MRDAFTVHDLKRVLSEGAGDDGGLSGDLLDTPFGDLGFESLALLETGAVIGREFAVDLDDSLLHDICTPRELIDLVNARLSAPSGD
ncbi:acyl carrier protein [Streptomyces sp. NPDC087294]|uniref:acyl carrier protein n=1 Tax=Streptomyces sp. NPDC087294 TaxID=3365777 RepID=UPI0038211B68